MINVNIKSTNFNMTPDIESMIRGKLDLVEKHLEVSDENPLAEVEIERLTHQKKGEVFRAEVNLSYKGKVIRAENTDFDIRNAIENVRQQVEKRIRRGKGKRFDIFKKGARQLKRLLRRGGNE
jgi:ribosomal subunit interface protein